MTRVRGFEQQAKANIYRLLSACYYEPCPELKPLLVNLEDWIQLVFPKGTADVSVMRRELEQQAGDVTELVVDYARLFIGPFNVLAPPYGSVYLEKEGQVMGDSTVAVSRFYQEVGLKLDPEQKDLPDHIAVELEFLYYLIFRRRDREYQQFLELYLAPWIDPFCDAMESGARTEFYRSLAKVTRGFLSQEKVLSA
ncbi:MAG: molecular chaperone [Clostridia bacterium]|jgi:TorA maturation chaperone TorD|nr:molecular chaperone [Clostridia bacterium]